MKNNLRFYKAFGKTPAEAQKTIAAGKLKGMTDINPMWRIKALTEAFGPQGEGWKLTIDNMWTNEANNGQEIVAWCQVSLYWKMDNGEWSAPVPGIGGSKFYGKGIGDGVANDECFKMAYTDAIAIACKGLGMSADIYFSKDRTKYDAAISTSVPDNAAVAQPEVPKFITDPATAEADFAACKSMDELKKLYNEQYGGNAHASKEIKQIVSAALTRLSVA